MALIEELMELREDTFDITKVADFIGEDAHTYIHIIWIACQDIIARMSDDQLGIGLRVISQLVFNRNDNIDNTERLV